MPGVLPVSKSWQSWRSVSMVALVLATCLFRILVQAHRNFRSGYRRSWRSVSVVAALKRNSVTNSNCINFSLCTCVSKVRCNL